MLTPAMQGVILAIAKARQTFDSEGPEAGLIKVTQTSHKHSQTGKCIIFNTSHVNIIEGSETLRTLNDNICEDHFTIKLPLPPSGFPRGVLTLVRALRGGDDSAGGRPPAARPCLLLSEQGT